MNVRKLLLSTSLALLPVSVFPVVATATLQDSESAEQLPQQLTDLVSRTESDAVYLLNSMTTAMQDKSYYGNFVYISDDKLESMDYAHLNQGGKISERLYSLNGEAREILKDESVLTCVWPSTKSVVVDSSIIESQLPAQLPVDLTTIKDNYNFKISGQERIADFDTTIVSIQPKDSYRYGYKFWIEKESKLLLKSSVINEQGRIVEQMMFTNLTINDFDASLLSPVSNVANFQKHEVKPSASNVAPIITDSQWQSNALPKGFTLKMHQRDKMSSLVEHLVFSDGMSSLSVFIESKPKASQALKGYSEMGAVNAFGRFEEDFHITAVGEVPSQTVRLIGESFTLKQ